MYNLGQRRVGMQRTRERILVAARRLLRTRQRLTLEAVAAAAGVSRPTMYEHFGSRRGLVAAVIEDSQQRGGLADAIAAAEMPDPVEALNEWLAGVIRFWAKEYRVLAPGYFEAERDPELRSLITGPKHPRRMRAARLVARLRASGMLGRGWADDEASLLLWSLTGLPMFLEIRELGTRRATELTQQMASLLLRDRAQDA